MKVSLLCFANTAFFTFLQLKLCGNLESSDDGKHFLAITSLKIRYVPCLIKDNAIAH